MLPGRDILTRIEHALLNEQGKISEVGVLIDGTNNRLIKLEKEQADEFRELARLKVNQLASGDIIERIDNVEQQVINLLQARERARLKMENAIIKSVQNRKNLEDERKKQTVRVDEAARAVDNAEAKTQIWLNADISYQEQRHKAREAERIAKHAEEKASRSVQELQEKGKPYRNDPLFMYLWNRHYGTAEYRANPLTRWLDCKVAKLVGFSYARANYFRLQEIPKRLGEHSEQLKKMANEEFEALRKMDIRAREEDGIPALEAVLKEEQEKLDAIDQWVEESVARHRKLLQEKSAFALGEDEAYLKAINYLAEEMSRDDLQVLRHEAISTPFPEDDVIVNRLLDYEKEKVDLEHKKRELKRGIQQHQQRLSELESLRADFRRNHYDQVGSVFSDGALVAMTLADFVNGMLNREALWRIFEQQHRYRPYRSDPGFGSGGFGRGTVWGGGIRFPRGGGFNLPSNWGGGGSSWGGGSSGGGFRTGGGF